jgi:membrane protease YdiL (CAAX protease family)
MVFARLALAVIAQALVAGLFALRGNPTPWQAAAPWWVVYGTLIDIACLAALAWLTRREGLRLFDLIGYDRRRLGRDLLVGLGFIVIYFVLFMGGGMIFGPVFYGVSQAPSPYGNLPLWGALFSLIVWPVLWAIAEQMTYLGYSLPRLEALSARAWLAVLIVCIGWAIQHSALALMPGWRWAAYRFASALPIALVLPIIYLRTRRLLPFIVAHWALGSAGVPMLVGLPLMTP